MRFLRLELRNYGPFVDAPPIPLDGGARGLHLIHGPNEAGKSTALRAIRTLLFGFPKSTGDNHGRDYGHLRIGAALRDEKGAELTFVRRKKDVRPLWTLDDSAPIDPETLEAFLGGLDATKFDDLFSMDHAELVTGGLAILEGRGNLGSILFAAGSGLATVDAVRESLEAEIDALFKPRASNPSINAALLELKAARDQAEKSMLATSAWVELDAQIAQARKRLAEVDAEWPQVDAEKRRLERLRKALPKIARLEQDAQELARRSEVPVLSDGFSELRRAKSIDLELATREARDSASEVETIVRELTEIGTPDPILVETQAIGQLQQDLGVYLKERRERPAREAQLAYIEADTRSKLIGLFPEGPGELRAIAARRGLIQELAQQLGLLEASCGKAEAEVARLVDSLGGVGERTPVTDAPRLAQALGEVVARVSAQGDLDGQLAEARGEVHEAERHAALMLRSLPLWSGSLDELEALACPPLATLDRFEADLRSSDEAIGRLEASLTQLEAEKLAIERDMEGVQLAGQVPTEDDLTARRTDRDASWSLIRQAWIDGQKMDDPKGLASKFEGTVRSADDLADRLRREADRVAAQAQRRATFKGLVARIAALAEDRERLSFTKTSTLEAWSSLWKPLGIDPLPPREMRDWLKVDRAALLQQGGEIRKLRAKVDRLAERSGEHRLEVARGLARLGEPTPDEGDSLASILDRARAAVAREEVALKLGVARSERSRAEAALAAWKSRWADAVGPLKLGPEASPTRANAVLGEVDGLIKATDDIASLEASIGESLRLEGQFEATVQALLDRLNIETTKDIETSTSEIKTRLAGAGVKETRREGLLKREADERSKQSRARSKIDSAEAALQTLAREARCESLDELPEAERASDEVKELRARVRELNEWLADLSDTGSVDQLREEAEGTDATSLEARIADLAERLSPLEAERNQLREEVGRCLARLEQMDGGPEAADAQQAVEERVAHLALDVERYARLRLASAVLREAVERYRKEHQGPVLDRAGVLFAGLTAGSFSGLKADLDDKGQPILKGVRADGSTLLEVTGMSEGTADQLYLALRLASLQTYLDDHEPMPLVVDDILVNFDNARALAALKALADLSHRTQILFFTHHDHLVDLARTALSDDVLFVHRLAFPPVSVPVVGPPSEPSKPRRKKATPLAGEA